MWSSIAIWCGHSPRKVKRMLSYSSIFGLIWTSASGTKKIAEWMTSHHDMDDFICQTSSYYFLKLKTFEIWNSDIARILENKSKHKRWSLWWMTIQIIMVPHGYFALEFWLVFILKVLHIDKKFKSRIEADV